MICISTFHARDAHRVEPPLRDQGTAISVAVVKLDDDVADELTPPKEPLRRHVGSIILPPFVRPRVVVLGRLREERRRVANHDSRFFGSYFTYDRAPPQILGHAVVDALAVVVELDRVLFSYFEALEGERLNLFSEVVST